MNDFEKRMAMIDCVVNEKRNRVLEAKKAEENRINEYKERFKLMADRINYIIQLANHCMKSNITCPYIVSCSDEVGFIRNYNDKEPCIGIGYEKALWHNEYIVLDSSCNVKEMHYYPSSGKYTTYNADVSSKQLEKLYDGFIKLESDFNKWVDGGCK